MANDSQINPPSNEAHLNNYAWDEPLLFAGVIIFCGVFIILFVLCCLCAVIRRRINMDLPLGRQGSSWLLRISSSRLGLSRRRNGGLDAQIIQALPIFVYTSQTSKDGPLECPVCLSEFQDGEKGRFLPNCKHNFHTECIDMWFHSHSNCPLCRTFVQPEARVENIEQGGGRGGGINIAFEQGQSSYGELEEPSSSERLPQISIDMSTIRANSFNSSSRQRESEEKKCPDEAQSSQFSRLHSLKRMLSSKSRDGKVFPDTLESDEAAIEKQGQS